MTDSYRTRLALFGVLIMGLISAMGARLWYLQVVSPEEYQSQAEANLIRTQQLKAPRGRVFDRNGNVLIDNRIVNQVTVDKYEMNDVLPEEAQRRELAVRLAREISETGYLVKADTITSALEDPRYGPFDIIPIAEDVNEEFSILLGERLDEFPGVEVEPTTIRDYPYRETAAHVLGYIGPISEDELEARKNHRLQYSPFDDIGKAGVERAMEDQLRGKPGFRRVSVDASHEVIEVLEEVEPEPGRDLYLTIDIDIQARLEAELKRGIENARLREEKITEIKDGVATTVSTGEYFKAPGGASVLMDPNNGEIIGMASYPTFDPQIFVGGISQEQFDLLNDEASHKPMWNRAVQEAYSPGSTFKLITAYAALDSGILGPRGIASPNDYLPDPGIFQIPGCDAPDCFFQNAGREANGAVNLVDSLIVSSDVYYYRLGYEFDARRDYSDTSIQDAAEKMGLGDRTGVSLPLESPGLMPTAERMRALYEEAPEAYPFADQWTYGDSINVAIGQGDVLATPLQMTLAYSAFANGGTVFQPSIATKLVDPLKNEVVQEFEPRVVNKLFLPDSFRQPILDGLRGVIRSPEPLKGTATDEFEDYPFDIWDMAAKTGTVERDGEQDSSVFAAFAPVEDPRYVMFTYVENGGYGAETSGLITRDMFIALATDDILRQPTAKQVEEYYKEFRPVARDEDDKPVELTGDVAADLVAAAQEIAESGGEQPANADEGSPTGDEADQQGVTDPQSEPTRGLDIPDAGTGGPESGNAAGGDSGTDGSDNGSGAPPASTGSEILGLDGVEELPPSQGNGLNIPDPAGPTTGLVFPTPTPEASTDESAGSALEGTDR